MSNEKINSLLKNAVLGLGFDISELNVRYTESEFTDTIKGFVCVDGVEFAFDIEDGRVEKLETT